ncbi:diguanylate cyclase (GGDEF) domain-containing protein [Denitrobacterium detoxificans]|uniref:Diguanylate cyclase (GGDEF) domain-containing protein n=2 Tax=Denitrobacterium detoxificans TaxID=79604 RepID=A0A1H8SEF9_9ACTN|nr:diguanylate cyclase (GGDEF) domain-containing protein [Denitrobacterium detoxificans]
MFCLGAEQCWFGAMIAFLLISFAMIAAIFACARIAHRSVRPISYDMERLLGYVLLPVLGDVIMVVAPSEPLAMFGALLFFAGTDWMLLELVNFIAVYCSSQFRGTIWAFLFAAMATVDTVVILSNVFTGFVFKLEPTAFMPWMGSFILIPQPWLLVHQCITLLMFLAAVILLLNKAILVPAVYSERYVVMLIAVLASVGTDIYYLSTDTPLGFSFVAYTICALLGFFFAIVYKPFIVIDRLLSRVVSEFGEVIAVFDGDANCLFVNDVAREQFGLDPDDLHSGNALFTRFLGEGSSYVVEHEREAYDSLNGVQRYFRVRYSVIADKKQRVVGGYLIVYDQTEYEESLIEERKATEEAQFRADHDSLTGLYRKHKFCEAVERLFSENPNVNYAIAVSNVKDFSLINDIYGSEEGDDLLVRIATALREKANPGTLYARLASDHFAVCFDRDRVSYRMFIDLPDQVAYVNADRLFPVVVHVGLYEVTDRSLSVPIMIDRAMRAAKSIGSEYAHERRLAIYDDAMRDELLWSKKVIGAFDRAMREHQIRPYVQPQVNADGVVRGGEALARWIHPEWGELRPDRFIPIFERNGMIVQLDKHIWEESCRILRDWANRGIDMYVAVNISPRDFFFIDVAQTFIDLVEKHGIAPQALHLEITEAVVMEKGAAAMAALERLRAAGFVVEMDDFGSGYSSLGMLKDMPVDVLKVDMAFLSRAKDPERARKILEGVIALSESLGMPSIVEGVETSEQYDMLRAMGCGLFQGYYFARPMPFPDFEKKYLD